MSKTVWNMVQALTGVKAGRSCRCCSISIAAEDAFGMSEGVCRPCRQPPTR